MSLLRVYHLLMYKQSVPLSHLHRSGNGLTRTGGQPGGLNSLHRPTRMRRAVKASFVSHGQLDC